MRTCVRVSFCLCDAKDEDLVEQSRSLFFLWKAVFSCWGTVRDSMESCFSSTSDLSFTYFHAHKGKKKGKQNVFCCYLSAYSFSFCLTHMDSLQVFSATCRWFAFLMSASVLVPLMCRTWIESYWWSSTLHVLHFHCVLSNQWGGCYTQYSSRKMSAHVELFSDFKILCASFKNVKKSCMHFSWNINLNEV